MKHFLSKWVPPPHEIVKSFIIVLFIEFLHLFGGGYVLCVCA